MNNFEIEKEKYLRRRKEADERYLRHIDALREKNRKNEIYYEIVAWVCGVGMAASFFWSISRFFI